MSLAIINNNKYTEEFNVQNPSGISSHRRQIIKSKVLAIGKMTRNYSVLKENTQLVQQLKTLSSNGKLPLGILSTGEQGIKEAIIQNSIQFESNKFKEQKDHNSYQHQPTPNHKFVSREGHI